MILTAPVNNVPLKPIYLIHGYDAWQSMDAVQKINANFHDVKKYYFANFAQFMQFNKTHQSEILNKDLFCDTQFNKVIEISIGNGKFTKPQLLELNLLLQNLAIFNNFVIILVADKLDKATLNSSWVIDVAKLGVIIVTKTLSKSGMQNWVVNKFKQADLKITNEAVIKFMNIHQNNLIAAVQSIYKLQLIYKQENTIDTAKLLEFVTNNAQCSVFDLQNSLSNKDIEQVIYVLHNLRTQSQEEVLILWSIVSALKNGLSKINDLLAKSKLCNLFKKAAEIDLAIKNIEIVNGNNDGYVWALIMDLCLNIVLM